MRTQVAQIITAIASIEIPRQEWNELIPTLCMVAQGDISGKKHAALTTLGFICEDLEPSDISSEEVRNSIIQTLVTNIHTDSVDQESLELSRVAVKALIGCIPYASKCFLIEGDRDFVMHKILASCQSPDEDTQEAALSCLREVASQEYDQISPYFP